MMKMNIVCWTLPEYKCLDDSFFGLQMKENPKKTPALQASTTGYPNPILQLLRLKKLQKLETSSRPFIYLFSKKNDRLSVR